MPPPPLGCVIIRPSPVRVFSVYPIPGGFDSVRGPYSAPPPSDKNTHRCDERKIAFDRSLNDLQLLYNEVTRAQRSSAIKCLVTYITFELRNKET